MEESMAKTNDKLRECQQYRGTPDPIYGDTPFESVRKAAKEAMTSVFQSSNNNAQKLKPRIQGTGGGDMYSSNSNDKSWQSSNNTTSSFGSGVKGVFRIGGKSSNNNNNAIPSYGGSSMRGFGSDPTYKPKERIGPFQPLDKVGYDSSKIRIENRHAQGKLNAQNNRGNKKRKKGTVGGAWGDNGDNSNNNDGNNNMESNNYNDKLYNYEDSDDDDNNNYGLRSNRKTLGGNIQVKSDGTYEKKWLSDIVTSGGIGAKIQNIGKYVRQFDNLSKAHVLEALDEILEEEETWQKTAKALELIYALLDGNSSNDVHEYFKESSDNLIDLCNHSKKGVRSRAQKIVDEIGLDGDDDDDDDGDADDADYNDDNNLMNTNDIGGGNDNLLDIGNDDDNDNDDPLFSGIQTNDNNDGDGDMFSNLQTNDDNNNGGNDLLDMGASNNNNNTGAGNDLMDLMGDMTNTNNNNTGNDTGGSAFGFINNNQESNTQTQNDTNDSAFGFINSEPQKPNIKQQKRKPTVFDDLIGDTNTNPSNGNSGSNFAFMNSNNTNNKSSNTNTQNDDLAFLTQPAKNTNKPMMKTGNNNSSGFSFMNQPQKQAQQQSSGFGFMNQPNNNSNTNMNQMNIMMNQMGQMNQMNQMMNIRQMMANNQNNMGQMNQLMQQMNQLKMMQQMQNNQNNMGQMNPMNPMMQQMQRNVSNFSNQMTQVNQVYGHQPQYNNTNDIFASAMQPQPTQQQKPKKPDKDPFADLGLGSLK
eukprot:CAMPEP_0114670784 /NCGR_PEP_ID=MMETSP0191-20121206/40050_1 /TAXON_ID=126664 /ORGANISM="Sorites sp." /LENGTH=749 /DNA_ID=CAMNT_0001929065 /DNA_START=243 /DNA_END=2493 /DNA_ORIENTATION=-